MTNFKKLFAKPGSVATALPAFAFSFAAYLINPDNLMLQLTFGTLFVLAVAFVIGLFVCSGLEASELVKRSFHSRKVGATAIIMLASIIYAGVIPDPWRVASSAICLLAALAVLFIGCSASGSDR